MDTISCPDCGNVNPAGADRCLACGYSLDFDASQVVPPPAMPTPAPGKAMAIVLVVAYLSVMGIGMLISYLDDPAAAAAREARSLVPRTNAPYKKRGVANDGPTGRSYSPGRGGVRVTGSHFHESSFSADSGSICYDYEVHLESIPRSGSHYVEVHFYSSSGEHVGYGNGFVDLSTGAAHLAGVAVLAAHPSSLAVSMP